LIEISTLVFEHQQDLLAAGDQEVEKGRSRREAIGHQQLEGARVSPEDALEQA
jgi:hypothetical protein